MLTDSDLEFMRGTQQQLLPSEARIERLEATQDARGGWTEESHRIQTQVPCRVAQASQQDITDFGDLWQVEPRWVVSVPAGTEVAVDDVVVLGTSKGLRIVGVMNDGEDWTTLQRLAAVEQ